MRLSELVRGLDVRLLFGKDALGKDFCVSRVTSDSRRACEGAIFAPILGYRFNGADFIDDAYARGCRIFLSETDGKIKEDIIVIKTKNIRKTLAELSSKIYQVDYNKLKVIGITGTKGKTGIALSIAALLSSVGVPTFSIGTVGFLDSKGAVIEKTQNTTPEPTELHRLFSKCIDLGADAVALEVSSQALKDFRVYGVEFAAVVFSSLSSDHIGKDEHSNFTDYIRSKRSLFTDYKSSFRILNADDKYTPYIMFGTEKCIKCGFSKNADLRISDFCSSRNGSSFRLNNSIFLSKMPARYDAVNLSLAIVCASLISGKNISDFTHFTSDIFLPGRYERYNVNGRNFIIDYAHNKLSFISVFQLTRELFSGRILAVFGSVGGRSKNRRGELAKISEAYADYSIITSDNPNFEPASKICDEIYNAFSDREKCEIVLDREEAIFRAYELSLPGDVILLLGKGHEDEMLVMGRKIPFSEREIIKKLQENQINEFYI